MFSNNHHYCGSYVLITLYVRRNAKLMYELRYQCFEVEILSGLCGFALPAPTISLIASGHALTALRF